MFADKDKSYSLDDYINVLRKHCGNDEHFQAIDSPEKHSKGANGALCSICVVVHTWH